VTAFDSGTAFSLVAAFNLMIVFALAWSLKSLIQTLERLARLEEQVKLLVQQLQDKDD
jgi:hypothetical protein